MQNLQAADAMAAKALKEATVAKDAWAANALKALKEATEEKEEEDVSDDEVQVTLTKEEVHKKYLRKSPGEVNVTQGYPQQLSLCRSNTPSRKPSPRSQRAWEHSQSCRKQASFPNPRRRSSWQPSGNGRREILDGGPWQ